MGKVKRVERERFCACGCGQTVLWWAKWKAGHHSRGINGYHKYHQGPVKCGCGCGQTVKHPRYSRFCPGHQLKGTKLSKEHKKKLSDAHKGKALSKEHKLAIGRAHKGRVVSEETREKLRAKVNSAETRRKMSRAKKGTKCWKKQS